MSNSKLLWLLVPISLIAIYFLLPRIPGTVEPCAKHVEYQGQALIIKGLSAKIGEKKSGMDLGEIQLNKEKYRETSEQLEKMDMFQNNLCQQFKNMPPSDEREKLRGRYLSILMDMYEMAINPDNASHTIGLDKPFIKVKEDAQDLWNRWEETKKHGEKMPIAAANEYALMGKALSKLNDKDLNDKTKIMKNDRESLMYFIASEIIIQTDNPSDLQNNKAEAFGYSRLSHQAAERAHKYYQEICNKELPEPLRHWVNKEDVRFVTLDRLAESQAQMAYFDKSEYTDKLDSTLRALPCDYINRFMRDEQVYTRITIQPRFIECRTGK